jgi:hypothetical protein
MPGPAAIIKYNWVRRKAYLHKNLIEEYLRKYPNLSSSELSIKIITETPSLGVTHLTNLTNIVNAVKRKDFMISSPDACPGESTNIGVISVSGNADGSQEMKGNSDTEIKSLQGLLKFFKVDPEQWIVEKWECTTWQSHVKLRHYDQDKESKIGYHRIDDEHKVIDLYRVWARLSPNKPVIDLRFIESTILKNIKKFSPIYKKIKYEKYLNPAMQEINIFDLHLGKRGWMPETGTEYNLEIARELFLVCLKDLINKGQYWHRDLILFPVGNDFFNADNPENATSSGRHIQDEDERWRKTFSTGLNLIREAIDLLQNIAPVEVPIIPGNHDRQRSQYLGYALEGWYHNNPNVTIDNSPKLRKYKLYGNCLIGYTHGHDEKLEDLPITMANEVPELFSRAKFKEWHIGDKHFKKEIKWLSTEEMKGVTVRRLRSLTGTDAWHYLKGYVANVRAAESFIWDKTNGLVSQFSVNYHGETDERFRDRKIPKK